jgi:predicted kinase
MRDKAQGALSDGAARWEGSATDSETRSLNESAEFQEMMRESERSVKEGRTVPAAEVFRRQRERRARAAAGSRT